MATSDHEKALDPLVAFSEQTRPLAKAIRRRLEYPLADDLADRFVWIGAQMNLETPTGTLEHLQGEWLVRLRAAVLDHVREGVAASHYHLDNVRALEEAVIETCLANLPPGDPPPNGVTTAPGGLGALNYEYQAFRFALRRTLDYLAVAVAAGFRCGPTKFLSLEAAIGKKEPESVRRAVLDAIAAAKRNLADILTHPTARNRIAHEEAVQAGTLNIMWRGNAIEIGLLGGGEELAFWADDVARWSKTDENGRTVSVHGGLGALLEGQLARTETAVFSLLAALGISTSR